MPPCYPDRYGVSDHRAVNVAVAFHQADDYRDVLQFVSMHEGPDGTCVETPIDLTSMALDSAIVAGDGTTVAYFTIQPTGAPGTVEVTLPASITATMRVGSYVYHIETRDVAGKTKTRVRGNLEVRPR
jgi:hypothetical protein